jgi:hypothetical protein
MGCLRIRRERRKWFEESREFESREKKKKTNPLGTSGINHIEKIAKALLGTSMTTNGRETQLKPSPNYHFTYSSSSNTSSEQKIGVRMNECVAWHSRQYI